MNAISRFRRGRPVLTDRAPARTRDEPEQRGQSVSLLVVLILGALFATAGLVIDGGQKVAASARAEGAASGAARAAGNAAATDRLGGNDQSEAAMLAARAYLRGQPGVTGTVSISAGIVSIQTQATAATIFLGAVGIGSVRGEGQAQADLVGTRSPR